MTAGWVQRILPKHFLSNLCGWFVTRRWRWLKNWQIRTFLKKYPVNLQEALEQDPLAYATFNDFFCRQLHPQARPIDDDPMHLVSPVDGHLMEMGAIAQFQLLQAKGKYYALTDLVGKELAEPFKNGQFINLYLSPNDYHRVHAPMDSTLLETSYLPGQLFSVNPKTVSSIPYIYARNERLVCRFQSEHGEYLLIMVGALLVNGIVTRWSGKVKSRSCQQKQSMHLAFKKGEELGKFEFGSTVILILPEKQSNWAIRPTENAIIHFGSPLLKLIK